MSTIKYPIQANSAEDIRGLYTERKGERPEVTEQQVQAWLLIQELRDRFPNRFKIAQIYLNANSRPTVAYAIAIHSNKISRAVSETTIL